MLTQRERGDVKLVKIVLEEESSSARNSVQAPVGREGLINMNGLLSACTVPGQVPIFKCEICGKDSQRSTIKQVTCIIYLTSYKLKNIKVVKEIN